MSHNRSQSLVRDLEELTSLALLLVKEVKPADLEDERLRYAAGMFKAMWYAGDAIVRTHPASDYYLSRGNDIWIETWNPIAIKVLNRLLIDAYIDFHHLFLDDDVEAHEAEFRLIMAHLHGVRNTLGRAPDPVDGAQLDSPSSEELYHDALLKALPERECHYKRRLAQNPYFMGDKFTDDERSRVMSGNSHNATFRYGGVGRQPGRSQKASRARLQSFIANELYGAWSDIVHAGPAVPESLVFFSPRIEYARQHQIDEPVRLSSAMLALAANGFAQVFPSCSRHLKGPVGELVDRYASLVTTERSGGSEEGSDDSDA